MTTKPRTIAGVAVALLVVAYAGTLVMSQPDAAKPVPSFSSESTPSAEPDNLEQATFGAGCFWCTEAVFEQLRGVESVVSGYTGGQTPNPTYEQVCSGRTGHAEAVQITYDPKQIAYDELLKVFWQTHDPTTLNRQGPDAGTQYRSAIFYHTEEQRRIAEAYKQQLDQSGTFKSPIVTQITRFEKFYPAEKYHQQYFQSNPAQSYCALVIRPKVEKFRKEFTELLKEPRPEPKAAQP